MKNIGNPVLDSTVLTLRRAFKSSKAKIWRDVSNRLLKSASIRTSVNIGKISRITKPNDVLVIPGKVLGDGEISHRIVIGAFSFTRSAVEKITLAGGEVLTIPELMEKHQSGAGVIIIGG